MARDHKPHMEPPPGLNRPGGVTGAGHSPPEDRVNLLEELASFCQTAGEFPTALEYYSQILDLAKRARENGDLIGETARKMALCYEGTGQLDLALKMLDLAISRVDQENAPDEVAGILIERSYMLSRKGDYEAASGNASEALEILQKRPMSLDLGRAFRAIGHIALRTGRMGEARDHYESSLAICRALGDRADMAVCYNNLGLVCKNVGHLDEATQFQQRALSIARDLGQKLQIGIRLNNLGIIEFKRGNWETARESWDQSLRIFREIGNKWEISFGYLNLAHYYRAVQDWSKAEELYTLSLQSSRENEDRRGIVLYHEHFGELCLRRGEHRRAEKILSEGLTLAEEISPGSELTAEILRRRGESRLALDDLDGAGEDVSSAITLARQLGDRFEEGAALRIRGFLRARQPSTGNGFTDLRRSMEIFTEIGARYEQALSQTALAELMHGSPVERRESARMLASAAESFRRVGSEMDVARARMARAALFVADHDGDAAIEVLAEIQPIIEARGSEEERARLRDLRLLSDHSLVTDSISESNSLSTFNVLLKRIQSIPDPEDRLQETLEFLVQRTEADRLLLLGPHPTRDQLQVRESRGVPPREWHTTVEVARMAIRIAMDKGGHPIFSTNPLRDSRIDTTLPQLDRVGSLLVIPVRGEQEYAGGIYLERSVGKGPFGKLELDLAIALVGVTSGILADLHAEAIRNENLRLKHKLGIGEGFEKIVTQSPRVLKIIETLQKLRQSDATILLQGETGTGKELFSRAIHDSSRRKDKPFITVNCAELSEDVLESELFGHKQGAFTDAKRSKQGLFERASGGTVFIDEVDKASRYFQDTLLRVVDRKEVKPVGETDPIPVDVRIICAANKDLRTEVEQERFLKDLYYRLRVVSIHLPPLRERKEDISILAEHFLSTQSTSQGKKFTGIDPDAMRLLVDYGWPGNVRDLAHEIERIVAISPGGVAIGPQHLSPEITSANDLGAKGTLSEVVERIEQQMIREALQKCKGNKSRAARELGLSRRGFLNKLQRYRIR